jgi:hypothetical protein
MKWHINTSCKHRSLCFHYHTLTEETQFSNEVESPKCRSIGKAERPWRHCKEKKLTVENFTNKYKFSLNTFPWCSLNIRVSSYGFNSTVLQHITIVNGCPKVILDGGLVADVKLQIPGLHAHLTWILSNNFCGNSTDDTSEEMWYWINKFANEIRFV